ncbi:hypothetical protein AB205_0083380 [Aquarana catesbeiana]|uniref:Uncharacterized protein n=1 Tax=Aquarana catesbeiana TaxID=8400 RepID=A0A2G9RW34_AQUCT|nr:hypothetical protein AB205_0083380 [Aquarana catesbeiana]
MRKFSYNRFQLQKLVKSNGNKVNMEELQSFDCNGNRSWTNALGLVSLWSPLSELLNKEP